MYLLPITVPIYIEGDRRLIASDWERALFLLRDSLGGRYGELVVAAPFLSAHAQQATEQRLVELSPEDQVHLEPLFDASLRARTFWSSAARGVAAALGGLLDRASVVHTGLDELFRPMTEIAFLMAMRRGIPTVFVQDTDIVAQGQDLAGNDRLRRTRAAAYGAVYERICRASVARADLTLLKGKNLMARYGQHARNAREIHDTSYLISELAPRSLVQTRLETLSASRPLRFVYCGRQ